MSLFQKSVEKKYLSELDSDWIKKKFAEFLHYEEIKIEESVS